VTDALALAPQPLLVLGLHPLRVLDEGAQLGEPRLGER